MSFVLALGCRGALLSRLDGLDYSVSSAIRSSVQALPDHFEIVDLRLLIPAMGLLAQDHAVNQLAAEAVAAAAYLRTPIEVEMDTPPLRAAAGAESIVYRVIGPPLNASTTSKAVRSPVFLNPSRVPS